MRYNISLDIAAVLVLFVILINFGGKRSGSVRTYRIYKFMATVLLITSVFDIVTIVVDSYPERFAEYYVHLVNIIYLLTQSFSLVVFTYYIAYISYVELKGFLKRFLAILPYAVTAVLIVTSPITGLIYTVEDKVYKHASMFNLLYVISLIYFVAGIVITIANRKHLGRGKVALLSLFFVIIAAAQAIQIIAPDMLLVCFASALCLSMFTYRLQNQSEMFDANGALRKDEFMEGAMRSFMSKDGYTLIAIKLLNIDYLYKAFGDDGTEKLLNALVSFLYDTEKRAAVIRADSDVFMVRINGRGNARLQEVLDLYKWRFEESWRVGERFTRFIISYGVIKCPDDAATEGALADVIDNMINAMNTPGAIVRAEEIKPERENREVLNAVKKCMLENKFMVYYQPIYSTDKQRITAAEALVRLYDEKMGFISPEIFIPIAEKEGYILQIGRFVFETVCEFYEKNNLEALGIDYIEVNLSPVQCLQYKLADEFIGILEDHHIGAHHMNFEITETSAIISRSKVNQNIETFTDYGIPLSLDDYGTGYSNISYIYNMPFSYIKIDKGILWSSVKNEKAYITLKNTVEMAKRLEMKLIVEGVETEEQIKMLRELGCDYFQGYYFSKPVPDKDFLKYVEGFKLPECCR